MDKLADAAVDVVDVLVLEVGDLVLFEVAEGLEGVEATGEVVEDDTEDFHEGHVVEFEDCTFSYVYFYVSALEPGTFEKESVFLFCVAVDYPHLTRTCRTKPRLRQHPLRYHPAYRPPKVLRHTKYIQISLKTALNDVTLNRPMFRRTDLKVL